MSMVGDVNRLGYDLTSHAELITAWKRY